MDKRKELNEEDLNQVNGGVDTKEECEYFLNASGKSNTGKCDDCFYYHANSGCSIPGK